MKNEQKQHGYWTKERCIEEALKYNRRSDFQNYSGSAYNKACVNKWLNEICLHMKYNSWTKEKCQEEALKYKSKVEFKKKCGSGYNKACVNKWIDEICSHMQVIGTLKKRCIYAAEFSDNHVYIGLTYSLSNRIHRHLNDVNSSIYKHIIKTKIDPEFKQITDYIEINIAKKKEGEFVTHYQELNWNILNQTKTGTIGGNILMWTKEKCAEEALKYNLRIDFTNNSRSAYKSSINNGWLDEICSHMNKKWKTWNFENCKTEALKYKTRNEYQNNSRTSYDYARKYKWFDEICLHMPSKHVRASINECKLEALKYETRSEFMKKSPLIYKTSYKHKILNEICQHMIKI